MRNIEWLKEKIGELPCTDTIFKCYGSSYIDSAVPVANVYDLLNRLDEPEVLSQEWVDKHKVDYHNWIPAVPIDYLQKLLVPKQELPVIPKFVAEWIEGNKQFEEKWNDYSKEDAMNDTIHFTIYGLFADYPSTNSHVELRKPVLKWLSDDRGNYFKLVNAVRYGYEVEEEQKYQVEDNHGRTLLAKMTYSQKEKTFEKVEPYNELIVGYQKELTEQEIKDYDRRYMTFAIPVDGIDSALSDIENGRINTYESFDELLKELEE